jgi:hypothetical protein
MSRKKINERMDSLSYAAPRAFSECFPLNLVYLGAAMFTSNSSDQNPNHASLNLRFLNFLRTYFSVVNSFPLI